MNSWANRRKFIILISLFVTFLLITGTILYFLFFNTPATCFDNKKNADELGIDCGGSMCTQICQNQAAKPIVHFARAFEITKSTYNAAAEIENVNPAYIGLNAEYSFKLYSKDNVLIGERDGVTTLLPHKVFTIFEGAIDTGNNTPDKVFFTIDNVGDWQKSSYVEPVVQLSNQLFSGTSTSPRLEADIQNTTLNTLSNIETIALLYDQNNNAIGSSRTYIDTLGPNAVSHIIFTWPKPFATDIVKIEVQTEILPQEINAIK